MYGMNIVIGLGNPGNIYKNTRHNVGFEIVHSLAETLNSPKFTLKKKLKAEVCKVDDNILAVPTTYMNGSGFAAKAVIDYYKKNHKKNFENVYVVHDDLDLALGEFKVKFASGPVAHNGLLSVYQHLGTKNFWHVRVGIDGRDGDRSIEPASYVLHRFAPGEQERFNAIKPEIVRKLIELTRNHA